MFNNFLHFSVRELHVAPQGRFPFHASFKIIEQINNKIINLHLKKPWRLFEHTNVLGDKGNPHQIFFEIIRFEHLDQFQKTFILANHEIGIIREYVQHVSYGKDALINNDLHVWNITCESDLLLISDMSSKDVVTRPFDAKCLW